MPTHASANPEMKQLYINGHFCYVYKFGIITNGLGIIRHISFYNKDFLTFHPEIVVEKKSNSPPDEDKCVHDAKLLIPTRKDFFVKHPLINPKTFLGDAAFDSCQLYGELLTGNTFGKNKHFTKAYIPLNSRSGLENPDYTLELQRNEWNPLISQPKISFPRHVLLSFSPFIRAWLLLPFNSSSRIL